MIGLAWALAAVAGLLVVLGQATGALGWHLGAVAVGLLSLGLAAGWVLRTRR